MLKVKKLKIPYQLLFGIGLLLVIIPGLFYLNQTIQLTFFTPKVTPYVKTATAAPSPISIKIPAINVSLPIEETTIQNNTWGISAKGASHLASSARPNEKGPIILYAHNTLDRFGPIRWLTKGKDIIITTADNKNHTYTITKTAEVSADQLDIFNQQQETLILYTCDGFADLKRFIVFASPK